uniref:Uncharacterized protein n=1 Tax=Acrobeloides nanus TaxID=290746 RepID=A0A914C6R4_9BILA
MRTAVASEVVELCNAVIRRGNDIVTAIDMAEDGKMKQYNQLEHEIRIQRDRFVKLEQLADLFIRAPEPITTVNACNFLQKAFTVVGAKRESTQANYEKIQRHPFMKYESDVEPLLKALANYGQLELDGVKKTPLAFTNPNAKMFTMLNNPMMPSTSAQRPPAPAVPRLRFPINAMHMNPPAGYANQVPNGTTTPNLTNPVFQQRGVVSQGMIEMRQNSPSYPPTVSMHHMHPRQPTQPMRLPFPHVMHDPSLAGPMPSPTNMQPNHAMPQQFHSPRAQMPQMRANFPYHQLPPEFQQQVGPGFPINQAMSPQANMLHMPRMPISAPQLPITTSADPPSNGNAVPMTLASSSDNANHLSEIASPVANSPSIAAPLPTQITSANVQSPKPSTPVSDIPLVKLVRDNTGAMKATLQPRFPETASSNASTSSEKSNTDARRATTNGMSEKTETRKDSSSSKNETGISKKADENLKTKDDERGKPINPEDWDDYCYVCNQGCDEKTGDLGCCSTCPRVFHNQCHIPIIEAAMADLPDDWQCSVCLEASPMTVMPSSFTDHEQLLCSKVILYCCKNNQQVEPFLYPVPKSTFKYYDIIKQPTDFSKISRKLSTFQYKNVGEFIQEMNLVFMNCSRFNAPQLQIALAGKAVYSLYIEAVKKYMPCMQKHVWIYVCLYQDKTFYEVEGDDPKTIRTKSKSPIPKKPRKEVPNPNPIREVSALNASKEIVSSNS